MQRRGVPPSRLAPRSLLELLRGLAEVCVVLFDGTLPDELPVGDQELKESGLGWTIIYLRPTWSAAYVLQPGWYRLVRSRKAGVAKTLKTA